jgi:hypothetical protein
MRLHNSSSSAVARAAWSALGFEVVEEVRRRELRPPSATKPTAHEPASRSRAQAR